MAAPRPKTKKVSEMFYSDPERGQRVVERVHKAKQERRQHPTRKKRSEADIQIVPDSPVE